MANGQVGISHATGAIFTTGAISAGSLTLGTPLAVAQGGTEATTAAARTNLAVLGIANNLSEISTAGVAAQSAARGNLAFGTMGTQNANAITITACPMRRQLLLMHMVIVM